LVELLEELPSGVTGLGATEMRMLEMLAWGFANTNPLFHLRTIRGTRIFGEWECGYLLDGLAFGSKPAVAGLDEELRTLVRENLRCRHRASDGLGTAAFRCGACSIFGSKDDARAGLELALFSAPAAPSAIRLSGSRVDRGLRTLRNGRTLDGNRAERPTGIDLAAGL